MISPDGVANSRVAVHTGRALHLDVFLSNREHLPSGRRRRSRPMTFLWRSLRAAASRYPLPTVELLVGIAVVTMGASRPAPQLNVLPRLAPRTARIAGSIPQLRRRIGAEENLEQRQIGTNGPTVGIIGMGTMAMAGWYGLRDDSAAVAAINRAIDLGITLFDTADLYGGGENERFVGSVLGRRRDEIVLGTKWGHVWDEKGWPNGVNGRPEHCVEACDDSLKRLGFDHIDLYYLHRVDPDVAIEESIGAMGRLVEQGKVRWIGVSETSPETLRRAHAVHPVAALQTEYSLWSREPEAELFECLCGDRGWLCRLRATGTGLAVWQGETRGGHAGDRHSSLFAAIPGRQHRAQ